MNTVIHGEELGKAPELNLPGRIPELDGRLGVAIVLGLIAYAAVRSVFASASTAFWYDELCTWIVAKQPTVSGMYGSAGELRAQFYIAHDAAYLNEDQFHSLRALCEKCSGQVSGFASYLESLPKHKRFVSPSSTSKPANLQTSKRSSPSSTFKPANVQTFKP